MATSSSHHLPANIRDNAGTLRMRTTILTIATLIVIVVLPAHAEEPIVLPEVTVIGRPPKNTTLPGTSQTGAGPTSAGPSRCGAASIGGDQSFGCLNETLKRQVDQINPVLNAPPIDAKSQDLKVGTVNIPAVQQQYGQNFGHSVIPYRPPPLVFTSPLTHR
jgi:hypothetical protein